MRTLHKILLTMLCVLSATASATLYNFTQSNFTPEGELIGSFTGSDVNGDGQITYDGVNNEVTSFIAIFNCCAGTSLTLDLSNLLGFNFHLGGNMLLGDDYGNGVNLSEEGIFWTDFGGNFYGTGVGMGFTPGALMGTLETAGNTYETSSYVVVSAADGNTNAVPLPSSLILLLGLPLFMLRRK